MTPSPYTHVLMTRRHYYRGHLGGRKGWYPCAKGLRAECLALMAQYTSEPHYLGYGEYAAPDYKVVPSSRLTSRQKEEAYWVAQAAWYLLGE